MGNSTWGNSDRDYYRSFSASASKAATVQEVFTRRNIHPNLDPTKIVVRESVDSEANPASTPVIVALDVTGSMGRIAHEMAKEGLGTLIEGIIDRKPVIDPHIMFMAVGDAVVRDQAPLQVSQFEADVRIVQQLADIFVEGHGGGNDTEGYDIPWYFAAKYTKIDSVEKRQKKGYLFTIGDEMSPNGLRQEDIDYVFGVRSQQSHDSQRGIKYTARDLLEMAQEKYHVFHIIVEQGNFASRDVKGVTNDWRNLMGRRAVGLNDYKYLSQVILSVMDVSEGADPNDVIASWQDRHIQDTVRHALID